MPLLDLPDGALLAIPETPPRALQKVSTSLRALPSALSEEDAQQQTVAINASHAASSHRGRVFFRAYKTAALQKVVDASSNSMGRKRCASASRKRRT
jgi:hypothetical protein